MEFFVFLIFLFLAFAFLGGGKAKPVKKTRNLRAGGREDEGDDYPPSWKNYEQAERGEGGQDDVNSAQLYAVSKAKLETDRRAASEKLSYKGLPTSERPEANRPKTKNKGRTIIGRNSSLISQKPLVQDMNMQRRLFLSSRSSAIFGEREKQRMSFKTILVTASISVVALYMLRTSLS